MALALPVIVVLSPLVFAFAALWFAHYALAALQQRRATVGAPAIRPLEALPQS